MATDIPMTGADVVEIGNTTGTVTAGDDAIEVTGGLLWPNGPGATLADEIGGGIYVSSGATAQRTGDLIDGNQARVSTGPYNGAGGRSRELQDVDSSARRHGVENGDLVRSRWRRADELDQFGGLRRLG